MLRPAGGSENNSDQIKQTKDALMKDLRLIFEKKALKKWLDSANDQLGGEKPRDLLGTSEQRHLVDMVEAVKYGLPT